MVPSHINFEYLKTATRQQTQTLNIPFLSQPMPKALLEISSAEENWVLNSKAKILVISVPLRKNNVLSYSFIVIMNEW